MANTILIKSKADGVGVPTHGSGLKVAELAVNTSNTLLGNRGHVFMGVTAESATNVAAGGNTAAAYAANQTGGIVWVGAPILDEDNMASDDATKLATQQSIKKYVDDQLTASDLDATTDSGTIDIALGSETLTVAGGEGIDTSASGTTITITGEEAGTSNKGVASFSSSDFDVSSGAVSIKDNSITLAYLAGGTDGNIISYDASGDPVAVATGSDGQVLTSAGSGQPPAFETPASAAISTYSNAANNYVVTSVDSTSVNSEANLQFDGSALTLTGTMFLTEQADAASDVAGKGQLWVNTATPNELYFTDDAGTDIQLTANTNTQLTQEQVEDYAGAMWTGNTETGITITYQDGTGDIDAVVSDTTVAGDSGSTGITPGDTLTIAGTTNEIATAMSGDTLTISLPDNVTINGNLTVEGTTTTVDSTTVAIGDGMFSMAKDQTGTDTDAVDIGMYSTYDVSGTDKYRGIFCDVSDSGKWKLFKDLTAAPTATVNTGGGGYAAGTLVVGGLEATANIDIGAVDLRASTLTADSMTATRVAFYGANGVLSGDADMTFATDTLTVTKIGAFEAAGAIDFSDENMTNVDIDSGNIAAVTMSGSHTWSAAQNFATGTTTVATIDCNAGAIDGTTVGAASASTVVATTLTATTSNLGTLGSNVDHGNYNSTNVDIDSGAIDGTIIGAASAAAITCTTLNTGGKLTAGSNEIEGSNFDINGGTVDAITSLTVANSVDIGNYTLTANGLTIDGTFTDGTMSIAAGAITSATIDAGSYTAA